MHMMKYGISRLGRYILGITYSYAQLSYNSEVNREWGGEDIYGAPAEMESRGCLAEIKGRMSDDNKEAD